MARENARKHEVADRIRFLEGDLFRPLDELDLLGQVDVITANPPYIRIETTSARFSPRSGISSPRWRSSPDPRALRSMQRIMTNAPRFLNRNGTLIMEMGIGQAEALESIGRGNRQLMADPRS